MNGASFFGFMGVSMALVLASKDKIMQISEQRTGQQKQAQASAVSRYGGHQ